MSPKGNEEYRIEGYHPRDEFVAQLKLGLARIAFMSKHFDAAERWYDRILQDHPHATSAAEAKYWRAVCRYNASHDPTPLQEVSQLLAREHPNSLWTTKSSVWLPAGVADRASVH